MYFLTLMQFSPDRHRWADTRSLLPWARKAKRGRGPQGNDTKPGQSTPAASMHLAPNHFASKKMLPISYWLPFKKEKTKSGNNLYPCSWFFLKACLLLFAGIAI
jgi:hypothetical protein